MRFSTTVEGDPIAKGRPRTARGVTYTPPRTREAEKAFRAALADVFPFHEPFDVPVGVELVFHCKTRRRVDWDNLAKLVTDSMNGLVYRDDVLIEECRVKVMRGSHHPRTEVFVWVIGDPTPGVSSSDADLASLHDELRAAQETSRHRQSGQLGVQPRDRVAHRNGRRADATLPT